VTARLTDADPFFLGQLNGELYFSAQSQLWKTDGTPAGTLPLTSATPLTSLGSCPVDRFAAKAGAANGLLFLSADDAVHGQELWRSNGTPQGTFMAKDINPSGSSFPRTFTDANGIMYFEAAGPCCGIWRSDGTNAGTSFLFDQRLPLGSVNGLFVFERDGELWRSDGTPNGAALVAVLNPAGAGLTAVLATHNGKLYFTASDGSPPPSPQPKLWVTDGTSLGTLTLIDAPHFVHAMTCREGQCYYFGGSSEALEIWRTDGTPAGTSAVAELDDGFARELVDVNGTIYFTTYHGLWRTDGTAQGTGPVFDAGLALVSGLTSAEGALFFIVREADSFRRRLWKSDGTPTGTVLLHDLGDARSAPALVNLDGTLVVGVWGATLAGDPPGVVNQTEWQLYKSDATHTGIIKVADLVRTDIHCPTPLCSCALVEQTTSMLVDGKWYLQVADPTTFLPALAVVANVYFRDVPLDHWSFPWVERLVDAGLTAGCGVEVFCPEDLVTRDQMAVFLLRGRHGASFLPPPATGAAFADVPGDFWASAWIERLAAEGITSGCEDGNYCPSSVVTRAQMAILLLRAVHGPAYAPPAATGSRFSDVPIEYWAASWVEQLAREGLTAGCGDGHYCPDGPVTRAEMAIFLTRTFDPL
jgi:ELWxxDGT repeat protein